MYFLFRFCYFHSAHRFAISFLQPLAISYQPPADVAPSSIHARWRAAMYRLLLLLFFFLSFFLSLFCVDGSSSSSIQLCGRRHHRRYSVFAMNFFYFDFQFSFAGTTTKNSKKKIAQQQHTFQSTHSRVHSFFGHLWCTRFDIQTYFGCEREQKTRNTKSNTNAVIDRFQNGTFHYPFGTIVID